VGQTPGQIRHDIEQTRSHLTATLDAISYKMDVPARVRYRFSHVVQDVSHVFAGKPNGGNGGNGGEPGLLGVAEERIGSVFHSAQGRIAGAIEGRQTGSSDIKEGVVETMTTTGQSAISEAATKVEAMGETTTEVMKQTAEAAQESVDRAGSTWSSVVSFARDNALALGLGAFAVGMIAGMFIPYSRTSTRIARGGIAPLAGEMTHRAAERAAEAGGRIMEMGQQVAKRTWPARLGA
jgi:hypothetical protein